jgi:hypothetical protein
MEFKVGMKVVLEDGYDRKSITEVTKITPKGFVKIKGSNKTFKDNGYERNSDCWHRSSIKPATDRDFELVERAKILGRIKNFKWWQLSTEKLREIDHLITLTNATAAVKEATK